MTSVTDRTTNPSTSRQADNQMNEPHETLSNLNKIDISSHTCIMKTTHDKNSLPGALLFMRVMKACYSFTEIDWPSDLN